VLEAELGGGSSSRDIGVDGRLIVEVVSAGKANKTEIEQVSAGNLLTPNRERV